MRNSVRTISKNSVAFSSNAQTAAVRLRHAFKRHARRGVSAGSGALLLLGASGGMVVGQRGADRRRRTWGRCAGARRPGWTSELEALGKVRGNAVAPVWSASCAAWRGERGGRLLGLTFLSCAANNCRPIGLAARRRRRRPRFDHALLHIQASSDARSGCAPPGTRCATIPCLSRSATAARGDVKAPCSQRHWAKA